MRAAASLPFALIAILAGCAGAPVSHVEAPAAAARVAEAGPIWKRNEGPRPIPVIKLSAGSFASMNFAGATGPGSKVVQVELDGNFSVKPGSPPSAGVAVDKFTADVGTAVLERDGVRETVEFLAMIVPKPVVPFAYAPPSGKRPATVAVAGEFNGWNGTKDLLEKQSDGTFAGRLAIPPGQYRYKLVVDGEWMADPANPKKEEGGYGNSILDVAGSATEEFAFEVMSPAMPWSGTQGGFAAKLPAGAQLDPKSVIVLLNNKRLGAGEYSADAAGRIAFGVPADRWLAENHATVFAQTTTGSFGVASAPFISAAAPRGPRDEVIYFAFTDRFRDGDPSNSQPHKDAELHPLANYHGGDFAGIANAIETGYFEKLGATALWISPVNENTYKVHNDALPPHRLFSSYHGYWPTSLTETNKRFGTMQELKDLVAEAHRGGMAVLFDFVANHLHEDADALKRNPQWISPLKLPDGTDNIRQFDAHPYSTWFDNFLPDIDYENADARAAMADNGAYWLRETGADGYRLDAVKHINTEFWRELIATVDEEVGRKEGRSIYTVGETISSRGTISEFLGPGLLDGQFDFPLCFAARDVLALGSGSMKDLQEAIGLSQTEYPAGAVMSPIVGNHDTPRFITFADGDLPPGTDEKEIGFTNPPQVNNPESYDRLALAMATMLSIPGAPTIYYGDEIGLAGAGDPDNRRPMPWKWTAQQESLYQRISRLCHTRLASTALRRGAWQPIFADGERMAFARIAPDEVVVVALSRKPTDSMAVVSLPAAWGTPKRLVPLDEYGMRNAQLEGATLSYSDGPLSWGIWRVEW